MIRGTSDRVSLQPARGPSALDSTSMVANPLRVCSTRASVLRTRGSSSHEETGAQFARGGLRRDIVVGRGTRVQANRYGWDGVVIGSTGNVHRGLVCPLSTGPARLRPRSCGPMTKILDARPRPRPGHPRRPRRPGPRPAGRRRHDADLPDLHLPAGGPGEAQGLRVRPHPEPDPRGAGAQRGEPRGRAPRLRLRLRPGRARRHPQALQGRRPRRLRRQRVRRLAPADDAGLSRRSASSSRFVDMRDIRNVERALTPATRG